MAVNLAKSDSDSNRDWQVLPLMLNSKTVDIWSLPLKADATQLAEFTKLLSTTELERALRLHAKEHQQRAIISAAQLRNILAQYLNVDPQAIDYQAGSYGKPQIKNYPVHFNMSHSQDHCLIAVSQDIELGIDLEQHRKKIDIEGLVRKVFHPNELIVYQQLKQSEHNLSFYKTWTCKEALVKALGTGLHQPLTSIEVDINPNNPPLIKQLKLEPVNLNQLSIVTINVPSNFTAHLVALYPTVCVRYRHF